MLETQTHSIDVDVKASGYNHEERVNSRMDEETRVFEEEMERARGRRREEENSDQSSSNDDEDGDGEQEEDAALSSSEEEDNDNNDHQKPRVRRKSKMGTKQKVQNEVGKKMQRQMRGTKTSRNMVKNRERRKLKESMNEEW